MVLDPWSRVVIEGPPTRPRVWTKSVTTNRDYIRRNALANAFRERRILVGGRWRARR